MFSANYGRGSWTVISLEEDGGLGEVRQHEEFSEECEVSHPHQTVVRGDNVWVVDLGCDSVWRYRPQAGTDRLERVGATRTPAGCGPRHMALHPSKPLAFLLCEQDSLVLVYRSLLFSPLLSLLSTHYFSAGSSRTAT